MTDWLKTAADRLRNGEAVALVTVCGVEGSAPREAGAKMVVTQTQTAGTIGGGALEFAAIARARERLAADAPEAMFEDFPLGPALGQCCGGQVRLRFERLRRDDLEWLEGALELFDQGKIVSIERAITDEPGRRTADVIVQTCSFKHSSPAFQFLDAEGAPLKGALPPLERCCAILEVIVDARPRIYVFGAGHVGRAMIEILRGLPVAATWIDRRAERLAGVDAENVKIIATDDEIAVARAAPARACSFVLTHSHQLDYDLVLETLKRGDGAYCGLIGSQTKRSRFERRLRRAGVGQDAIERLVCPIGGAGLESKDPAVIALSAIHEMLLAFEAHRKDV